MRMLEYKEMMSILFFSQPSTPRSRTLSESAINRLPGCSRKLLIELKIYVYPLQRSPGDELQTIHTVNGKIAT